MAPPLKRLGTLRHADFRRNDNAYFRSNPVMMRILEQAKRDIDEGRYFVGVSKSWTRGLRRRAMSSGALTGRFASSG